MADQQNQNDLIGALGDRVLRNGVVIPNGVGVPNAQNNAGNAPAQINNHEGEANDLGDLADLQLDNAEVPNQNIGNQEHGGGLQSNLAGNQQNQNANDLGPQWQGFVQQQIQVALEQQRVMFMQQLANLPQLVQPQPIQPQIAQQVQPQPMQPQIAQPVQLQPVQPQPQVANQQPQQIQQVQNVLHQQQIHQPQYIQHPQQVQQPQHIQSLPQQDFTQQPQHDPQQNEVRNIEQALARALRQANTRQEFKVVTPFDGRDRTELEGFLKTLRDQRQQHNISDRDALASVSSVLSGEARKWWVSQNQFIEDWDTFERLFSHSFGDNKHDGTWMHEMCNDLQSNAEPAAKFLQRIHYRISRLKTRLPVALQISIAYRGLRYELRNALSEQDNETWALFCARVNRLEIERFELNQNDPRATRHVNQPRTNDHRQTKFCTFHGRGGHATSECKTRNNQPTAYSHHASYNPNSGYKTSTANNTYNSRHTTAAVAPHPAVPVTNRETNAHAPAPLPAAMRCFNCQQPGHHAAACPQPRTPRPNAMCLEIDDTVDFGHPDEPFSAATKLGENHVFLTQAHIDGRPVTMFADNGSTYTTITKEVRDELVDHFERTIKTIHVQLADGRVREVVCERFQVPVQFDNEKVVGELLYSKDIRYPIPILGHHLMGQLKLVCDNTTKKVRAIDSIIQENSPQAAALVNEEAYVPITRPREHRTTLTLRDDEAIEWTQQQRDRLNQLLASTTTLFNDHGPPSNITVHHIDTANARPVFRPSYSIPGRMRTAVKELIDEMLVNEIIEPSVSPWGAPLVPRMKPDGSVRLCVDYRKLNEVTVPDRYPLPNMNDTLQMLHNVKIITLVDLRSGYWQLAVAEEDRVKTAFVCEFGLFQFNRMPFGLRNAPACFQRAMDQLRAQMPEVKMLAYLDDLAILSESVDEHIGHLKIVFDTMERFGLRLRRDKCQVGVTEFKYLGHIINEKGISPDMSKIEAIQNLSRPKNPRQIRSFIQTCGWFRRFIEGFAKICEPLNRLTKQDVPFVWSDEQEQAFQLIKSALTRAPILKTWNPDAPLTIITDASAYAIGAVLMQGNIEGRCIVEYASRQLNSAKRNYSATDREALAVVWAIGRFRGYLEGAKFTVLTDHQALKWLMNLRAPTGRLARWAILLQQFDMTIAYRPGKENQLADGLSRLERADAIVEPMAATTALVAANETNEIRKQQLNDAKLKTIIMEFESGDPTVHLHRGYVMQNGTLHIYPPDVNTEDENPKLVAPLELRQQVLEANHDASLAGHYGIANTLHKIRQRYWWPNMYADVIRHIRACSVCQRYKAGKNPPVTYASQRPKRRFEAYSIDLVGPLPVTEKGNTWILVMEEMTTRFIEIVALEKATSLEIGEAICNRIVLRYGMPRLILSDHGPNLVSEWMQCMYAHIGIKQSLTPEYHPASNMVERRNRDIKERIAMMVGPHHDTWDHQLQIIQFAVNTANCRSTGYSPAQLTYGCQPNNPIDPKCDSSAIDHLAMGQGEIEPTWMNLLAKINDAREKINLAQDKLLEAHPHTNDAQLPIGSDVLVRRRTRAVGSGRTPKLMPRWDGPYRIVEQVSFNSYKIANTDEPENPIEHVHRGDLQLAINPNEEPIRRLRGRGRPRKH
jgi:predicted aspartyl protease